MALHCICGGKEMNMMDKKKRKIKAEGEKKEERKGDKARREHPDHPDYWDCAWCSHAVSGFSA